MVLVELWIVSVTGVRDAPVSVWPLMVALLLVTGWSGLWLVRGLVPEWVGELFPLWMRELFPLWMRELFRLWLRAGTR